ncbi:MAG: hypothetical protein ABIE68_04885 [bacterium]
MPKNNQENIPNQTKTKQKTSTKISMKVMVWSVFLVSAIAMGLVPAYSLIHQNFSVAQDSETNGLEVGGIKKAVKIDELGKAYSLNEDYATNYRFTDYNDLAGRIEFIFDGQISDVSETVCQQDYPESPGIIEFAYDADGDLQWSNGTYPQGPCLIYGGDIKTMTLKATVDGSDEPNTMVTKVVPGNPVLGTPQKDNNYKFRNIAKTGYVVRTNRFDEKHSIFNTAEGGKIEILYNGLEEYEGETTCEERYPWQANFTYTEYDDNGDVIEPGEQDIQVKFCEVGKKIEILRIGDYGAYSIIITVPEIASSTNSVNAGVFVNMRNDSEYNEVSFDRKDGGRTDVKYLGMESIEDPSVRHCYESFPWLAQIEYQAYDKNNVLEDEGNIEINACADEGYPVQIMKIGTSDNDEVILTVPEIGVLRSDE